MARISFFIALIGSVVLIFTPYGILLEILALILAILALITKPKKLSWLAAMAFSLLNILLPLYLFVQSHGNNIKTPQWYYMPSAAQFNIEPNYDLKKNNFNFDSLLTPIKNLKNIPLATTDSVVGLDDAPMD